MPRFMLPLQKFLTSFKGQVSLFHSVYYILPSPLGCYIRGCTAMARSLLLLFFSADYILTVILQPLCTGSHCLYSRKHLLPVWLASTRIAHHPLGTMRNDVSEFTRFPALPVYYKDPMGKRTNRLLQFISLWVMSCSSLSSQLGYFSLCWASFSLGIVSQWHPWW